MEKIVLESINKNDKTISYSFTFTDGLKQFFTESKFLIEYPDNIESVPDSIAAVPFVANVIPIIWITNSELIVEQIDESFYDCLSIIKESYQKMFPETRWLGQLLPKSVSPCKTDPRDNRSAMFFSGGLDAVNTLINIFDQKPDLISIWGADIDFNNTKGWKNVHGLISKTAKHYKLNDIVIRSTFRKFDDEIALSNSYEKQLKDNWWHGAKHGLALLGHVAPYAYLHNITKMYIASSYCPWDGPVRCASSPTIDNNVRFANCQVIHDGFELSRQMKTTRIVEYCKRTHEYIPLHVCWETQNGSNCCKCEKCYRTMANLIAEGEAPENYGFKNAKSTLPNVQNYLISNKDKYKFSIEKFWFQIKKRLIENKRIAKKGPYWKYLKWLLNSDTNDIKPTNSNLVVFKIKHFLSHIKTYQLLHNLKNRIIDNKLKKAQLKPIFQKLNQNTNALILLFTPTHVNLGDHAIAYAITSILDDLELDYIEITDSEFYTLSRYDHLAVLNTRKIVICGGGFLGTIWPECEISMRKLVAANPDSKIVFSPVTVFYDNDPAGKKFFEESIPIYNNHKNISFFARERITFDMIKGAYKNVKLCPDMVFSLNKYNNSNNRNGCLLCLRNDLERTMSSKDISFLIERVENLFNTYQITDMHNDTTISPENRLSVLNKKFEQFKNAELVITDRLHGMIFSAITGTPCIVLPSRSHKILGCYDWVKDFGYIKLCNDVSNIDQIAKELKKIGSCKYDNTVFSDYFSNIKKTFSELNAKANKKDIENV